MKVAETPSIASRIALAFQSASSTTGTDFGYLVKTASRESNFDAAAKASSSSATGLFQFIESTWLETVKTAGAKHGLGDYADDITRRRDGSYTVSDPARRREILNLRKDPEISALMAGEFTRKNAAYLESKLGRQPSDGELYAAHFLGAGGASKLIRLAESSPDQAADRIFPRQARANRSIFYDKAGGARSVSQVLDSLVHQHDSPERIEYATVVAANKPVPTPVAKAQAIAAAAGVPEAGGPQFGGVAAAGGGANTGPVIASRYYRPDESEPLARALSSLSADDTPPVPEAAPSGSRTASAPVEVALATHDPVASETDGQVSVDTPPPTPAAKPEPPAAAVADPEPAPVSDPGVAVALAEAETVEAPVMAFAQDVRSGTGGFTASRDNGDAASGRDRDELFASGRASARISSAWRATEASEPFQALFRTGETDADTRFDHTFVSAFRARPDELQAAVEARAGSGASRTGEAAAATAEAGGASAPVPGQRPDGRPFDLTGFLKYQIFKEPEDLVPPA